MPFQPIPDTASFRFVFDRGGDFTAINTFYVRDVTGPWTAAALSSLAADLETWWSANLRGLVSSALTLREIVARDESQEFGAQVVDSAALAGTRGDQLAASIASAVIQWTGDGGGAPRRGFTHHIGLIETDGAGDSWEATTLGQLEDAYTSLAPAIEASQVSAAQVIVSRFANGLKRPSAVTNTLQDVKARSVIGSQQRRRRKTSPYVG